MVDRNDSGFSLIEAILSIATFMLFATALMGMYFAGTEGVDVAQDHQRASQIARAGVEAARSIRDDDFANLTDGTYGLQLSGGAWQLCSCTDTTDEFTRQLEINTVDSNTKEIDVTVSWQATKSRSANYTLTTQLTNWKQSTVTPTAHGAIRVNEYYINSGFTGSSYTLNLIQDLEADYFVIIEGSDGSGNNGGNYGPDRNYARLTHDPFATGELASSGANDQIRITRGASSGTSWRGVVKVVECAADCSNSGFRLRDAVEVTYGANQTNGMKNTSTNWSSLSKVMLVGGFNGAGCSTTESSTANTVVCFSRIYPSGTNQINWQRHSGGASLNTPATNTVMAVEWGSDWTIQRVNVTGTSGGNGADGVGEYDTAAINPVSRDNTWVWGTGYTQDNGIGDGAEGSLITLGNGVTQLATEASVAVGQEYNDNKNFEVYALTHPDLEVDYRFKPDGHVNNLIYDQAVDANSANSSRMALIYNGQNGTGNAYPRPMFSSRYLNNTNVRAERRRSGQNWPAWIQGMNFSGIQVPVADTTPPSAISNLSASSPTTNSVALSWTAPGDDGTTGTASSYDIRYSTTPITAANWSSATPVSGEPAPAAPGSTENYTVTGLSPSTTYYFAIRTSDEVPNESALSNVAQSTTQGTQANNLYVNTAGTYVFPGSGNRYVTGWIITNTGTSPVVIDRMTVNWTGGSGAAQIQGIYLLNNWHYGPNSPVSKGTNININDFSLGAGSSSTYNWLYFTNSMNNATLSITFTMADGSTKTVSGIAL